jgi:ABC-type multidrug transport system ATPase subunit
MANKEVFASLSQTGLDPDVRRLIWDIINRAKTGKTIILTVSVCRFLSVISDDA